MQSNYKLKTALEELRSQFHQIDAHTGIIDGKAKDLVGHASIILTLFGGLQSTVFTFQKQPIYYQGLTAILILFTLLLGLLIFCLRARVYATPFEPTDKGVNETILVYRKEKDVLEQLIANYIARIQTNTEINNQKADILNYCYLLFVVIMVLAIAFQFFVVNI